jgi:hypothetical protein
VEAVECPSLEPATKQRDRGHYLCVTVIREVQSRAVKVSNKSSYQCKTRLSSLERVTIILLYFKKYEIGRDCNEGNPYNILSGNPKNCLRSETCDYIEDNIKTGVP